MIVSSGSSGAGEKRWYQKAPTRGAEIITKRFADIAPNTNLRFDSGFGQPSAPRVLRPSKLDSEFIDFTLLFDVTSWEFLADATTSAQSQILGAIVALAAITSEEISALKQRCKKLDIPLVSVGIDDAPTPEPLADFHPDAHQHLPQDIFWDSSNDYGPVGNDTGADVLGLYRAWLVNHDANTRASFFHDLLAQWQLDVVQDITAEELEVRLRDSEYELLTWDDAIIGWAVSQIACDGSIDSEVRRLAEVAVARQSDSTVVEYRGWTSSADRVAALKVVSEAVRLAPHA
ncbi:hypothetical protein Pla175_24220 [Pirellulimonas nuda]|uniref:Uncharacterized protein n=1 Tax=Pirellulimonas nuda TaxID=2528009 RepID=A0A518DC82_9BACT|nr:hypothetical protein [Pirellulimonas nuda]QDU89036.1 hypothetical protein Pla175_24220 [Pirellulimonas nuda]